METTFSGAHDCEHANRALGDGGSRRYSVIGSSAGLCSPCVILERVRDLIHIVWARQSVAAQAEVDGIKSRILVAFPN